MKIILKIISGLIVICGAIGLLLFWLADPLYLKAPKDQELVTVFRSHRAEFEHLRKMAGEDSGAYVSNSYIDKRLSTERNMQYRRILSDIGSGLGISGSHQSVRFIYAGGGLSAIGPGWMKGIEYLPGDAASMGVILGSLDQPASLSTGTAYLYKIELNWFVVFEKYD